MIKLFSPLVALVLVALCSTIVAALPTIASEGSHTGARQWFAKRELTQEARDSYLVAITALVGFLVGIK
ncbi:hypothetical protein IW150_004853, partial [Coemansia sp. RSA 2607]